MSPRADTKMCGSVAQNVSLTELSAEGFQILDTKVITESLLPQPGVRTALQTSIDCLRQVLRKSGSHESVKEGS